MNKQLIKLTYSVLNSAKKYLEHNNYTQVVTPRIVRASGACENVNTLFEVSSDNDFQWFNGAKGYLAQTGQLYLEALVPTLGNVYCVGPSFRAEPKADHRHLTEFLMIEIEHPGGFNTLLKYIEGVILSIINDIINNQNAQQEFGLSTERLQQLSSCPKTLNKITYDNAIQILRALGEEIQWGDDITADQEQMLIKEFGNHPLFITRFPDPMCDFGKPIEVEKFFNMLPDPENPGRVLSADLILPHGGESVGAAARIHEAEMLTKRLKNSRMFQRLLERGGGMDDFNWYINQVKNNETMPHAGCGFGMSRIIQWILAEKDIKLATVFPSNKEILI